MGALEEDFGGQSIGADSQVFLPEPPSEENVAPVPLLRRKSILAANADSTGKMWFGLYEGGVVVLDGNRFHAYSERNGLAGGSVNAVYEDERGTVWIGAEQALSRLEGQRFAPGTARMGLRAIVCNGFSRTVAIAFGLAIAPESRA